MLRTTGQLHTHSDITDLFTDGGMQKSDVDLFRQNKVLYLAKQLRTLRNPAHSVPQPLELSTSHYVHVHLLPRTGGLREGVCEGVGVCVGEVH